MSSRYAAALLAAAAFAAAPLQAQFVNGSFESPIVGSGTYQTFSPPQTFPGWTVVGAQGSVAVIDGTFTNNGYSFPAESGAQWLDLTGVSNSATGVQQTLATTVGQSYDVSFWVGNVSGNNFGSTSTVSVLVNDSQIAQVTNSTPGTTMFWQMFTTSFTATGTSTDIAFINADPNDDSSNGLDNVSITPTVPGTTTPEPSSLALLGTGLIGVVPMMRRRLSSTRTTL